MKSFTSTAVVVSFCALLLVVAKPAGADPLPGQVPKFAQLPLNSTVFPGHDELSTATFNALTNSWSGTYMADDFGDKVDTPVVHVEWWGSYLQTAVPQTSVQHFLIAWETDVPAVPGAAASHPGQVIQSEVVSLIPAGPTGPGQFTENAVIPPGNPAEPLYHYNAELALPFNEIHDQVYWLKIVAMVDPQTDGPIQWGWHNRDYTIQDTLASTTFPSAPANTSKATSPASTCGTFRTTPCRVPLRLRPKLTAPPGLIYFRIAGRPRITLNRSTGPRASATCPKTWRSCSIRFPSRRRS